MKKYLVLASLLAMSSAHADWLPNTTARFYTLTINYGGGSRVVTENSSAHGPLHSVADSAIQVPVILEQGLNTYVTNVANSNGGRFASGNVDGSIHASIRPNGSGVVKLNLSGFSYSSLTLFSGTKFGIVNYTCQNNLRLSNIAVNAQYGVANGSLGDDVGLTFDPSSYTDCDTNIGWIVPGVDLLVNSFSSKIDAGVTAALKNASATVKDSLLFSKDQNLMTGLDKLVPVDTIITLPNGGTFQLGQYVQNNFSYLLANSQMDVAIDRGAIVQPTRGIDYPGDISGNVVTLAVTTPGTSFSVQLKETAKVRWTWICNYTSPSQTCVQP